ncbi:MAG: S41 family peptidase [Myxococcota bacterium]
MPTVPLPPLSVAVLMSTVLVASSRPAASAPERKTQGRSKLVEDIAQTIEGKYHDPAQAKRIAEALRGAEAEGRLGSPRRPEELAGSLSTLLASFDPHFNVRYAPAKPGKEKEGPSPHDRDSYLRRARRANFGFEKVTRLAGNVGYLRLRSFENAAMAGPTVAAAMAFLNHTDALIIDLRRNGGGDPGMVQLLASYFFEDNETHLNNLYWRPRDFTRQLWTLPYVPGERRPDVPLFILTSRATGSAAEAFGYHLQALKRATLIGTPTVGAANPGDFFRVGDYLLFVSTGRAINPVTQSNWEGSGVQPDVEVPAHQALDEALTRAWTLLRDKSGDKDARRELDWALEEVEARRNPVETSEESLRRLVGVYGVNKISWTDGALKFQRRARAAVEMIPLGQDRFMPRGQSDFRLVFERDGRGRAERLHAQWSDGYVETSAPQN